MSHHLIVIVGPTAVGKTAACIQLAQALGTEIVSADSRQLYQRMVIGTAQPTPAERQAVPHHLVDFLPLTARYSAGDYQHDVLALLPRLFNKHRAVILTGGSGLYIDAVCHGLPAMPEVPQSIQDALFHTYKKEGLTPLREELRQKDPDYFAQADLKNPKRMLRALAVCRATGQPFTFFRNQKRTKRDFHVLKIGLERPRDVLYARINQRVDQMIDQGLWQEAQALYPYRHLPALATIGYPEIFDALEGKCDKQTAIARIKQHSRHYAKRQFTWFKKDAEITWFHPDDHEKISAHVRACMDVGWKHGKN